MSNLLNDFIFDPENYQKNYDLGLEYYKLGQTASAICFFLRCADRCKTEDIDLAYECLIHIGDCFFKQGNRLEHVRCMYKQALSLLPKRPEAYYKLAHFENINSGYPNAYFLCSQAFELCDFKVKEFVYNCGYTGEHCILFEKTTASWYWGKVSESKDGLTNLYENHWNELTEEQKDVVKKQLIEYHKVDIECVIDKFYADPNSIEWGNLTKDPETKDYLATELINGIYSKFFDVEEGDVVFDIGASVGLFPLTVLKKNPKEIHCFEPNKVLFDAMTKNLKSFDNLYLNNIGISEKKGDEVFLESTYAYDNDSEKFVSTTTFMDYVKSKGIEKIDFLKTDCEGGEWDIFTKENYPWIRNNVRKIAGEFHIHGNPLFRKKFIEFRDLYLKNAENVVVFYSNKNTDVYEIDVWDDSSVEKISYCNVSFELSPEFDWGPLNKNFRNIIDEEIFKERMYEQHFTVDDGDVVVDVGANCGAFTYSILDKNPEHVFCIEPSLELVQILDSNLKNHKDKVTIIDRAISHQTSNDALMSADGVFIYNHDFDTYKTINFKEFVEKYNISKIDFLKTDCEGGEWDIFTEENRDYIRNNVKKIVGEFHICNIENTVSKFKIFRDLYLKDVKNLHVYERSGKEVTEKIFDDQFLEDYKKWWQEKCPDQGQLMVYVEYATQMKSHFGFSKIQKSTTWIVDNFYEDPDSIRKFALDQDYHIGGIGRGYIGNRTHQQFLFPGLKERFEEVMGRKITRWEDYDMNGRFQYCWAGQPRVWHMDNQMWGGMIYLSPDAPFECGTSLFAHKKTRARSRDDEGWGVSWTGPGDPHLDGTPFEPVDVLGNVYNRLVLFDASCIHSASEYFGTVKENCRLWQMFFFDTES